jgi:putative intracellular protease/amidase
MATTAKAVHFLVFEGYADWEPALALAELRRSGKLGVVAVGFTKAPITSMGGLQVVPSGVLSNLDLAKACLFLLPGGEVWEQSAYPRAELEHCLRSLEAARVPVAAICSATLALARAGMLDTRAHTSNSLEFLMQNAPEYRGEKLYDSHLAVRDRGVITASGVGHTEFAREILSELKVFSELDRATWFDLYKTGKWPTALA